MDETMFSTVQPEIAVAVCDGITAELQLTDCRFRKVDLMAGPDCELDFVPERSDGTNEVLVAVAVATNKGRGQPEMGSDPGT
jgi:hypothetical protein